MAINLNSYLKNNILRIKVIPNSDRTALIEEEQGLKLYLNAPPDKNKANLALIKFFKKELNVDVEIKSGLKSREKTLRIIN